MRSLRVKLLSCLMVVCLAVGLLIVGVWAVGTQTINLKGNVDFTIADPSLYVKDIRLKNSMEDTSSAGETIANFVPGYVNTTMNLNLGQIDNTTGGLSIYIDIINTTDTTYIASTTTSISGAEITVSGTINGDAISQGDILTTDTPSGTVEIAISAPNIATLDLSQISINLDELLYIVTVNDSTLGSASFSIEGDQVTLTATLNNNTEFLGWAENSEDGYVVCDLPTYTFTDSPDVAMTYVALFREYLTFDEGGEFLYGNYSEDEVYVSLNSNFKGGDVVIASVVNIDGVVYNVTRIADYGFGYYPDLTSITLPSTITTVDPSAFEGCYAQYYYFRSGYSLTISNTRIQWSGSRPYIITDSYYLYQTYNSNSFTPVKVLQSIDDGSCTFLNENYTKSSTEVINGRTYNVYTLN